MQRGFFLSFKLCHESGSPCVNADHQSQVTEMPVDSLKHMFFCAFVDLGLGGILCGGALGKWMRWGSPGPGHRLCKVFQVMLTHGQAQETLS